jgi:hypothetical protein
MIYVYLPVSGRTALLCTLDFSVLLSFNYVTLLDSPVLSILVTRQNHFNHFSSKTLNTRRIPTSNQNGL